MQTLWLQTNQCLGEKAASLLAGRPLRDGAYDSLVDKDCDVFRPDGSLLLKLRKAVVDRALCQTAYANLRFAAGGTNNRGLAGGLFQGAMLANRPVGARSSARVRPVKEDGTLSSSSYGTEVDSGIVGYFDRNARYPYCRQTSWSLKNPAAWTSTWPFIQAVDGVFKREMPRRHGAQMQAVGRTNAVWVIPDTSFTTITVNRNWQTAVHKDAGDLEAGFGVMTCMRRGQWGGCLLCFPEYRVAVRWEDGDVLLADVHAWHGNTPFINFRPDKGDERLSMVFYYRENMHECLSLEDELQRVKDRGLGPSSRAADEGYSFSPIARVEPSLLPAAPWLGDRDPHDE